MENRSSLGFYEELWDCKDICLWEFLVEFDWERVGYSEDDEWVVVYSKLLSCDIE